MTTQKDDAILPLDLIALGIEDGQTLFDRFAHFFDQKISPGPVETMLLAFDEWGKIEVLAAENRLIAAGLTSDQVSIWKDSCVTELNRRLAVRAEQKSKEA